MTQPLEFFHYRTIEEIGRGAHGTVYKAWDSRQDRVVALKVLSDSDSTEHLDSTIAILKRLTQFEHPHLCTIIDVIESESATLVVMEYIEGDTLAERFAKHGPGISHFDEHATQLAEVLHVLHSRDIIHGNIKPSNVMLTESATIKLCDAGFVTVVDRVNNSQRMLPEGVFYMAPELIESGEATVASDLYSLGALLYQMITLSRPYEGESPAELVEQILQTELNTHGLHQAVVSTEYVLVIQKLLSPNPEERFGSASELLVTLEEIAAFDEEHRVEQEVARTRVNPRIYLLVSLTVVLLVIIWYMVTTYR